MSMLLSVDSCPCRNSVVFHSSDNGEDFHNWMQQHKRDIVKGLGDTCDGRSRPTDT